MAKRRFNWHVAWRGIEWTEMESKYVSTDVNWEMIAVRKSQFELQTVYIIFTLKSLETIAEDRVEFKRLKVCTKMLDKSFQGIFS